MKLLVIENDKELAGSMVSYLEKESYTCVVAFTCGEARQKVAGTDYECIVLARDLPDGSGLWLLQELSRDLKGDGVIVISANNSIEDRVSCLRLGADDCLAKPFQLPELAARIAAIIRRKAPRESTMLSFCEIHIDPEARLARAGKELLELTPKEYLLLHYFITNKGKVISQNTLINQFWPGETGTNDSLAIIYAHIKNLRRKLRVKGCPDYIRSVYGMGYILTNE
ncbi:response regulator transcription factor [Paraflavisolibacter sp. H34]|uniref:response regulator transcription factor n=1 Tax=Huijunlia imazamoxiresistens TaxID=3127457 RepID=UPI00301724F9